MSSLFSSTASRILRNSSEARIAGLGAAGSYLKSKQGSSGVFSNLMKAVRNTITNASFTKIYKQETKVNDPTYANNTAPAQNTSTAEDTSDDTVLNTKRKKRGISDLRVSGVNRGTRG